MQKGIQERKLFTSNWFEKFSSNCFDIIKPSIGLKSRILYRLNLISGVFKQPVSELAVEKI